MARPGAVGEMKSAMLSEADFQAQFGDEWILADGRDVTGSKYEILTGQTVVPDARGLALRGKNNGRSTAEGNEAGDLALGTYENDTTRRPRNTSLTGSTNGDTHSHTAPVYAGGGSAISRFSAQASSGALIGSPSTNGDTHSHTATITSGGDTETRVRSITVNHFIKIN